MLHQIYNCPYFKGEETGPEYLIVDDSEITSPSYAAAFELGCPVRPPPIAQPCWTYAWTLTL